MRGSAGNDQNFVRKNANQTSQLTASNPVTGLDFLCDYFDSACVEAAIGFCHAKANPFLPA